MNKLTVYALLREVGVEAEGMEEDTDLVAGALLDSMSLIALISLMEEKLGVTMSSVDYNIDNFRTIRSLCNLIGKYRK